MIAADINPGGIIFAAALVAWIYSPIWIAWLLDHASKKR